MDPLTPALVTERLYEAGLARMTQKVGGCWPSGYRCAMPEPLRDPEDLKYAEVEVIPDPPTTAELTRADEVDQWIRQLPPWPERREPTPVEARMRKIVLDRMRVNPHSGRPLHSWRRLGDKHNVSHTWAKAVWLAALGSLAAIANQPRPPPATRIHKFSVLHDRRETGV